MLQVFPDYYSDFRCIAGACRHSCCIGWEIDVDEEALSRYAKADGPFGERLRQNISAGDEPHFILGEDERCPFLNDEGLCDMILQLGEDSLCQICRDHPRFRNELPGRVETGLGLCCEAACQLILGKETPTRLEVSGQVECEDEIVALRNQVLPLLQRRQWSIPRRVEEMLRFCGAALPESTLAEDAAFLLTLERLEEDWTRLLHFAAGAEAPDTAAFDAYMKDRQTEYEQLLCYLVYRHMANAFDEEELAARTCFASWAYRFLRRVGAAVFAATGEFTFPQQAELCRLFSAEIEYSQDNMDTLLDQWR